ncbi:hypothetical protein ACGFNU_12660 [Spirillospora sp. NPDC048911]|uniref:hypothetical protein n=1 Tax=Spirillospora sp. NPDC048911 TaxID=3364527 RepID=UPI00371225FD
MTPESIRQAVSRGQHAVFTVPDPFAAVSRLKPSLAAEDIDVFVSGASTITAMRLVSREEAGRARAELDALMADFRRLARQLAASEPDPESWHADPHGEHCRFENVATGVVVEVNVEHPDALDPYFLLEYAETSGGYPGVMAACVHGYHDMRRLLQLAGHAL